MTERSMRLEDWLDDLCVRFILNVPLADLSSLERICFQVEEAQWFYEDFIRPLDPALPSMSLRNFCVRIFAHCPIFSAFSQGEHMHAFEQFMEYKQRIPVRGAILLNEAMDAAVLVKGWKKNANWSFPRGKINKDEDDLDCAIREVYEETGYNLVDAGMVPHDRNVTSITVSMKSDDMQLFVFRDIPMDTHFEPRTRKEISKIEWWPLSDLPAFRKKGQDYGNAPVTPASKFFMVAPFLVKLRKWIIDQKKRDQKRMSNQYLSTDMNDETYTEDDRRGESASAAQINKDMPEGMPDGNSLEDASAALNRLMKIQQHPQELQVRSTVAIPPANNTGDALLALLRPSVANQPPHTPLEHNTGQPEMPPAPHNHQPGPPLFSSIPPPPSFPIHPQPDAFSYQQPHPHVHHQNNYQQDNLHNHHQVPRRNENPHHYQSQHLVHPQPLPPNVQRAVFTGGPVHSPMVPRAIQQHPPSHYTSSVSVAVANPQFPGLHATMVPPAPRQSPSKLTSHSLALLNAFRTRDQAVAAVPGTDDSPLRSYPQESTHTLRPQPQPQELHADPSQQSQTTTYPQTVSRQSSNLPNPAGALSPRPPISEVQRSTLLGLFKSPVPQAAIPVQPLAATALPSVTPSAVELSAVEPHSTNGPTKSTPLNDKRAPDHAANIGTKLQVQPGAQIPFRPASILARPADSSEKEDAAPNIASHKARPNGKKPAPPPHIQDQPLRHQEKPFQPQILKRPQVGTSKPPAAPSPLQSPFPAFNQPVSERHPGQPVEHRKALLSLFGKAAATSSKASPELNGDGLISLPPADPALAFAARSRVGSLASGEGTPRRGSQTPISPADKGFLFNYLDAVANGAQR